MIKLFKKMWERRKSNKEFEEWRARNQKNVYRLAIHGTQKVRITQEVAKPSYLQDDVKPLSALSALRDPKAAPTVSMQEFFELMMRDLKPMRLPVKEESRALEVGGEHRIEQVTPYLRVYHFNNSNSKTDE